MYVSLTANNFNEKNNIGIACVLSFDCCTVIDKLNDFVKKFFLTLTQFKRFKVFTTI